MSSQKSNRDTENGTRANAAALEQFSYKFEGPSSILLLLRSLNPLSPDSEASALLFEPEGEEKQERYTKRAWKNPKTRLQVELGQN